MHYTQIPQYAMQHKISQKIAPLEKIAFLSPAVAKYIAENAGRIVPGMVGGAGVGGLGGFLMADGGRNFLTGRVNDPTIMERFKGGLTGALGGAVLGGAGNFAMPYVRNMAQDAGQEVAEQTANKATKETVEEAAEGATGAAASKNTKNLAGGNQPAAGPRPDNLGNIPGQEFKNAPKGGWDLSGPKPAGMPRAQWKRLQAEAGQAGADAAEKATKETTEEAAADTTSHNATAKRQFGKGLGLALGVPATAVGGAYMMQTGTPMNEPVDFEGVVADATVRPTPVPTSTNQTPQQTPHPRMPAPKTSLFTTHSTGHTTIGPNAPYILRPTPPAPRPMGTKPGIPMDRSNPMDRINNIRFKQPQNPGIARPGHPNYRPQYNNPFNIGF